MEEFLGVKYVFVDSENFEEYLIFIGVGYIARKAALTLRPSHSLTLNENGTYTFSFNSKLVSSSVTFAPGVEFDEVKPDGVKGWFRAALGGGEEGGVGVVVVVSRCRCRGNAAPGRRIPTPAVSAAAPAPRRGGFQLMVTVSLTLLAGSMWRWGGTGWARTFCLGPHRTPPPPPFIYSRTALNVVCERFRWGDREEKKQHDRGRGESITLTRHGVRPRPHFAREVTIGRANPALARRRSSINSDDCTRASESSRELAMGQLASSQRRVPTPAVRW
ncbi:unnamed protein product, partial [Iphiclides podalirius]